MPLVSPYALRHLELSYSENITHTQRWGHRIIAVIEFIPLIGILASVIERIVALASQYFYTTSIDVFSDLPTNCFEAMPQHLLGNISGFLSVRDAAHFGTACCMANSVPLWHGQLHARRIPVPAKTSPLNLLKKVLAAEAVIAFCNALPKYQFPNCALNLSNTAHLALFDRAKALRHWLQSDPYVSTATHLDLKDCKLTRIPPEIRYFTQLQNLNLENNALVTLPPEIGSLSKLRHLLLNRNALKTLPAEIGNLSELTILQLMFNDLTVLPSEIGNLCNLTSLSLSHNALSMLPVEIGKLTKLNFLFLNHNALQTLPSQIENLTSLRVIFLHDNPLKTIPPEISNLSIVWLMMEHSAQSPLSPEVGNFSKLSSLIVIVKDPHMIATLPPEIGNLPSTCKIEIRRPHPQMLPFPAAIARHPNLHVSNY